MAKDEVMLTTFDNPFNPFTHYNNWLRFDMDKGYNTNGYLGRIAVVSDEMTDQEYQDAIESAIDEIIAHDFLNIYRKVHKNQQMEPAS